MSSAPHSPPGDTVLDQALALAALGLRVVPIKPSGVHPPMNSWQHAATDNTDVIRNWYTGFYRQHGLGIAMGPQPAGINLIAIDVDVHPDAPNGYDSLHKLEAEHGPLPETWRSLSGGGGTHILLRCPDDVVVRNQQAGGNRIAPGIDVRGQGGQIVIAPSLHHRSGRQYAWEIGCEPWKIPVADCPAWLLERVREPDLLEVITPERTAAELLQSNGESIAESVRDWWNWHDELEARGWTLTRRSGGDTYWTRPGKNPREGHSAVLHGDTHLVVFTTEIPDTWRRAGKRTADGSGYSFSPFGFLAATEHAGNRSETARALREAQRRHPAATPPPSGNGAPAGTQPPIQPNPDDELRAMLIDWPAFWAHDHADAEWIAEPVLPAGRSVALFAPGGTGKSLFALWLAANLATGVDPFSGRPQAAIDVLYLDYEMTEADLSERLEQMGYGDATDLSRFHYCLLPSLPGLDEPEGGKAVVRLAALCRAALVVIDTFGRAVHGDENDADTVRAWYRWTGLHLKHDGRAFARIDHAGKDLTKGQRGTSAKNDDVDIVWQMTTREGGTFILDAKKRRMGWVPIRIEIIQHDEPLRFELLHGETWPAGTKEAAQALDELDVPVDTSARAAGRVLSDAGRGVRAVIVRAAQKYRKLRSETLHFVDYEAVDNSADRSPGRDAGASQKSGRGPSENDRDSPTDAPPDEDPFDLFTDSGRDAGRGGTRYPDATGTRCVPPKGDARDQRDPQTDQPTPTRNPFTDPD